MKSKKALSLLLCVCMLMSLLAGCGIGQDSAANVQSGNSVKDTDSAAGETAEKEILLVDESEVNYQTNLVKGGASEKSGEAVSAKKETAAANKSGDTVQTAISSKQDESEESDVTAENTAASETRDSLLQLIEQNQQKKDEEKTNSDDRNHASDADVDQPFDLSHQEAFENGEVEYADNTLMVKIKTNAIERISDELKDAGVGKLELMFEMDDSSWYTAYLQKDSDVNEVLSKIRELSGVVTAEHNFAYEAASTTNIEDIDTAAAVNAVKDNKQFDQQWYMNDFGIKEGWAYADPSKGMAKGIIVAVIDTGVDYEHVDLKGNMWVNTGEIPNNGKDDDGNGYVDDYYGIDMTAKRGSAADDNGHGTHVAGIIAASNNKEGVVGLAYDAQIMAIKAGDASGYFLQDNVAKSIIYAYEHGADVINMSFGGSASSIAVQDALTVAYNRCVLVASAGNNGVCTEECPEALPNYPAAHKYVLGVMSVGPRMVESSFTNYDNIAYTDKEYEVYAPGEQILSTLPGNRYAKLSGTSMAAPVVAAQAAILRSMYPDRNTYPTKYIYAQIAGTAEDVVRCRGHHSHTVPGATNFYLSMTELPKPEIGMSDYTIFDSESFAGENAGVLSGLEFSNNGDGIVDAGEVIALGMTLKNRWGMSKNTKVHIDVVSDLGVEHPYVTFLNNDIDYKSIGTYSESDSGKLYSDDGEMWTGWNMPFYLKIDENIPNDYTITLNLTITYENGLDESDSTVYESKDEIVLKVRRGVILSGKITEDMTLTKDHYYIIPTSTIIMEGVTVTVEPGTQIQFWCSDPEDAYAEKGIAKLQVYGTFRTEGTADEPVEIFPSDWMGQYRVEISREYNSNTSRTYGTVELNNTKIVNPYISADKANGCEFRQNYKGKLLYRKLSGSAVQTYEEIGMTSFTNVSDSVFYKLGGTYSGSYSGFNVKGSNYYRCIFIDSNIYYGMTYAENCIFYGNNNYWGESSGAASTFVLTGSINSINVSYVCRDKNSGKTYMTINGLSDSIVRDRFFEFVGIDFASFETPSAFDLAVENLKNYDYRHTHYECGIYDEDGILYNHNGTPLVIENESVTIGQMVSYEVSINNSVCLKINGKEDGNTKLDNGYIVECKDDIYVTDIELKEYLADLDMGETYQIRAELTPYTSDASKLIYESTDEDILTVDKNGVVKALACGTAAVKVYSPDYAVSTYMTFNVKEKIALKGIEILNKALVLNKGESEKLNLKFKPLNTTEKKVTYASSDENVATVTDAGLVYAVGAGKASVTVSGEHGVSAVIDVTVNVPTEAISFAEDTYVTDMQKDDGTDFYPSFEPLDATQRELVWESSNPEICFVDNEGKLIKKSIGTAVLKATVKGSNISAILTVAVADELADVCVKKIVKDTRNGDYYALTENGDVWSWGAQFTTPKKLNINGIKDIYMFDYSTYSRTTIMTIDRADEGVQEYSIPNSNGICTLLKKFDQLKGMDSFAQIEYGCGRSVIVIAHDGSVWFWGANIGAACGYIGTTTIAEPIQLDIESKVEKAVLINVNGGVALYLMENGDVYKCYDNKLTFICQNAKDIYPTFSKSGVIDLGNIYSQIGFNSTSIGNGDMKVHETEKYCYNSSGAYSYYIDAGRVYVSENRSKEAKIDDFKPILGLENISDVFWFEDNQYFQTSDGKFYAMGSASGNALGTGASEAASEPVRVYFGLPENATALTMRKTNCTVDSYGHNILSESKLVLDWSQYLTKNNKWSYIILTDEEGMSVGANKNVDLNELTITPRDGFVEGKTYTLTVPANALKGRDKHSNEEYTLTFVYHEKQQNVLKMMDYQTESAAFKLALLDDGTLWAWGCDTDTGIVYTEPVNILSGSIEDFVISSDGQLYVLNGNGSVKKYTVSHSDFLGELKADSAFMLNAYIDSLSSEPRNCGRFYALDLDGNVWAWESSGDKQQSTAPEKLAVSEASQTAAEGGIDIQLNQKQVKKIVSREDGAVFLTTDGLVFIEGGSLAGKLSVNPLKLDIKNDEKVTDIYADGTNDNGIYLDLASQSVVGSCDITNMMVTYSDKLNDEEHFGAHRYYIAAGQLYIMQNENGYFDFSDYTECEGLKLTCVTDVFDFGENVYVQTEHGQLYAFGKNDNYALADKALLESSEAVQLHFKGYKGQQIEAPNTSGVAKMMSASANGTEERFALLNDGSLWIWGASHEKPVMLFDSGVKDFHVDGCDMYILDESGRLTKHVTSGDFVYSLNEDESFTALTGIKALSSESESTGVYYAVSEAGKAIYWTAESSETKEIALDAKLKKIVATKSGAALLTKYGKVYLIDRLEASEETEYSPKYIGKAADIRGEASGSYAVLIKNDGSLAYWNTESGAEESYDEALAQIPEEYEAAATFIFDENFYFVTADGHLYGMGSGAYNHMADSEITNAESPVEIIFTRPEDVKNDVTVDQEKMDQRHYWSADEIMEFWNDFVKKGLTTRFYSNVILNRLNDDNVESWLRIQAPSASVGTVYGFGGNYWGTTNMELINKQILDFDDFSNLADINEGEILTEAPEDTFPFVVDAYLEIGDEESGSSERVDVVGNDLVTFVVEFNRDMETGIPLTVRFGSYYPYADYEVSGEYVSPRVWKGTMQLTTIIENGYQCWSVSNGKAANTDLKLYTDWGRFPFKIDTSEAQAMAMQADSTENGIMLTWTQDDFETLAGYNVYRADAEDGNYKRLNKTVIPADTKEFLDDGVEPGATYYYNFTVVQTDFTESEPSGKITATALDTLAPNIYHTPVFHAFTGSNLVISANVTDNVGINTATLYYRTTGDTEWKSQAMTNYNDKYSAVIPSAEITLEGLEYYIEASDGISNTYKGTAEDPYQITVQLAISASDKGDVDGNGVIELKDAMMLLMHINDRFNLAEDEFARADLDDNGVLTAAEALRIIMYANGSIGSIL